MGILKDASPRTGIVDLYDYIRQRRDYNGFLWVASFAPPALLCTMVYFDGVDFAQPMPPTVTYFESWPANRSIEESMAAITKRQAEKDAFLEKQRQGYKSLGRAMGMDVEQIEKEAAQIKLDANKAAKQAGEKADVDAKSASSKNEANLKSSASADKSMSKKSAGAAR